MAVPIPQTVFQQKIEDFLQYLLNDIFQANASALAWNPQIQSSATLLIFEHYQQLYQVYQKKLMQDHTMTLDRHKEGALMARAILDLSPLCLKPGLTQASLEAKFANQRLAFLTALYIVQAKKNHLSRKTNTPFVKLSFPRANGESYEIQTLKAMYHSHQEQCFSVTLFANLLFLLETHQQQQTAPLG